jgi:hypothetical protein
MDWYENWRKLWNEGLVYELEFVGVTQQGVVTKK